MPTVTETQVLEVKANAAEVENLTRELGKEEAALRATEKAGAFVRGSQAEFDKVVQASRDAIARLGAQLDVARAKMGEFGAANAKAADSTTARIGGINNALRSLGYGVSDIFINNGPIGSKLIGFSNNISGM